MTDSRPTVLCVECPEPPCRLEEVTSSSKVAQVTEKVLELEINPRNLCRDSPDRDHDDARQYWIQQLSDSDAPAFPNKPSVQNVRKTLMREIPLQSNANVKGVSSSATVQLAWALTISQYTGSVDVVFGAARPRGDQNDIFPMRIVLDTDEVIQQAAEEIHGKNHEMVPYQQDGLPNIKQWTSGAGCGFHNILLLDSKIDATTDASLRAYPLVLQCSFKSERLALNAMFDPLVVTEIYMQRVLNQLIHNINQLSRHWDRQISNISYLNSHDAVQLKRWNDTLPEPIQRGVNELIADNIRSHPDADAICAWDGSLTYDELDQLSSRLALKLIQHGVCPGTVIPVYFPRSMWTPVVLLAITLTGAAFVMLDRDHPEDRLRDICQQVNATLVVCPHSDVVTASSFCAGIFPVNPDQLNGLAPHVAIDFQPSPETLLYVAFTSGSTGRPKGAMISHHSFSSLAVRLNHVTNRGRHTRRLALSSYAFDVSIGDIFFTLIGGGCVCIPPNLDDLPKAISDLKANAFDTTNSVLRTLSPGECPGVESVLTTGESPTRDVLTAWTNKVKLIQVYGPTECSVWCATTSPMKSTTEPSIIGNPLGCRSWIVDPAIPEKLMPIQGIGELVIEGPIVGLGYISNPQKTETTFISRPKWVNDGTGKVYRTGDLVQYTESGTLRFIGRKDRQVKLYGNRIELGEVEFQVQQAFSRPISVVAELIRPAGANSLPVLLAFVCLTPNHKQLSATESTNGLLEAGTEDFRTMTATVRLRLREILPPFMIPGVFLPVSYIPWTPTGKTDRNRLRRAAEALDRHELSLAEAGTISFRAPETDTEKALHKLFAKILSIPEDHLSADAHFFHAGGDSVLAWRLVMAARAKGIIFTGDQVLNHPVLSNLALAVQAQRL
ncbi:hypothetical protein MW887_001161 [Aspergillus wentii]|nr:hypothetical protein MW887_001161 [Aspergillus wentii]